MNLWFAPHQDDELLTLGISAVKSNITSNSDNHVYLCTDGSGSYVRKLLYNIRRCSHHKGIHRYYLKMEQFVSARDNEFKNSCLALGWDIGNVHFPCERVNDGSLSVENAETIMSNAIYKFNKYERIVVHTLFPVGGAQHSDHTNLGIAAQNLYKKGIIHELHLYIEPYCKQLLENYEQEYELIEISCGEANFNDKIIEAIKSYSVWDPQKKKYAIGYHSVNSLFDAYSDNPINYEVVVK